MDGSFRTKTACCGLAGTRSQRFECKAAGQAATQPHALACPLVLHAHLRGQVSGMHCRGGAQRARQRGGWLAAGAGHIQDLPRRGQRGGGSCAI